MLARTVFAFIALFWLTMNVLLWRAEFGDRSRNGSAVPVEVVWRKMLTAPDSSSLDVLQRGRKIGFCHWTTRVTEELAKLDEAPPEGMPEAAMGGRIRFTGSLSGADFANRLRFDCDLRLSTNNNWQELTLRLNFNPVVSEIQAVAASKTVRIKVAGGDDTFERVLAFSDFLNPQLLQEKLDVPSAAGVLGSTRLPTLPNSTAWPGLGLKWEAFSDKLVIRHEPVRVYRLQTRVLDRYTIVIFVSRAGEILRAELPDEILLLHDELAGL